MKFNTTLGVQTELKYIKVEQAPVTKYQMTKEELEVYLNELKMKNKYKSIGFK